MDQGQQFKIAPVTCNKVTHQGEQIRALCLRAECNQASPQCFMCVQELHQGCQGFMKMCKDVPILLIPLQSMKAKLIELKQNLNLKMEKLIKLIEETLIPISLYFENPNLTNLNKLGQFLKSEIETNTKKQLNQVQMDINSLFNQCKESLFTKSPKEIDFVAFEEKVQQLIKECKSEEALKMVEAINQQNQNDKRLLLNKGLILHELNRYQEAMDCYDLAIKIDPAYGQAWCNKGISLQDLDKNEEAIYCYKQATKIDTTNIEAWYQQGWVLNKLKRYQESIDCYNQAIMIDQNFAQAWNNKGFALDSLKRYQEAINCYDQIIQIDQNCISAWNNKGGALNELKRYQEAINCLDQGIKIDRNDEDCYKNKGYSLIGLKKYEESIPYFEQAIELKPGYEQAITGLKIAKEELKKLKK